MHALPFVVSLALAALLAPALLRMLADGGHTKPNYRGRSLPCPFGVLALAAASIALVPLVLLQRLASSSVFEPHLLAVVLYSLGVLALGLVDDTLAGGRPRRQPQGVSAQPQGVSTQPQGASAQPQGASTQPQGASARPPEGRLAQRGWRGHGAAALRGELSTGALKAGGSLGLALLAMSQLRLSDARWLLASAVLLLATNAFNLLDLRPGRSAKAFVLLGAGLSIGSTSVRALWTLGLFVAPALVAGVYDLRERVMLGDTGANLLGALAGLWLVLSLSGVGQLIALALLATLTLYGELRSISALVERIPLLRELDSWGRPS